MKTPPLNAARLYWFHQVGCGHCALAEPEVAKFQRKHPKVMVIKVNLARREEVDGWAPAGTPAYLLKINEKQVFTHIGGLRFAELEEAYQDAVAEYENTTEPLEGEGLDGDDEDPKAGEYEEKENAARDEEE